MLSNRRHAAIVSLLVGGLYVARFRCIKKQSDWTLILWRALVSMKQCLKFAVSSLLLAVSSLVVCEPTSHAQPSYKAVRITSLATRWNPVGLNFFGDVLLSADSSCEIWNRGQDSNVVIPFPERLSAPFVFIKAFNSSRNICGYGSLPGPLFDNGSLAFYWNGAYTYLDSIITPAAPSWAHPALIQATDVNDNGDVTGYAWDDSSFTQPLLWRSGGPDVIQLQGLAGYRDNYAFRINNLDLIAGDASGNPKNDGSPSPTPRAFKVRPGGNAIPLQAVDGKDISASHVFGINDSGYIVGKSSRTEIGVGTNVRPTVWTPSGEAIDVFAFHGDTAFNPFSSGGGQVFRINNLGMMLINGGNGMLETEIATDSSSFPPNERGLWRIRDLVINPGGFFNALKDPIDINDFGNILTRGASSNDAALLIRQVPGLVVNSTGDKPDLDPNDDRCYTGGVNSIGDDECTLRAAIQYANNHPGVDTIRFRIPFSGIPGILPDTPLPTITEAVVIDGRTQPGAAKIILDGHIAQLFGRGASASVDGLTVAADNVEIRGMIINNFSGYGLNLQSGSNAIIESNVIGTDTSGAMALPNAKGGILISGANGAKIGDDFAEQNVIAFNGGAGISITSGEQNTISRNIIHKNDGLGIDLGGDGVTENDPLDSDTGPNKLVNYPLIDSVDVSGGVTRIFGRVQGEPFNSHKIEIFFNDECDPSGYGEGERSMWTSVTNTDANGFGDFSVVFSPQLADTQFITMVATEQDGSTSEFSPCWPSKVFELVDGKGVPIANKTFPMSHVNNDRPIFTETLIDSITTDSAGRFDASEMVRTGQIHLGDSLKLSRVLQKSGHRLDSSFSVHLDNGDFDSLSYRMYYDTLDPSPIQQIVLDHTTFALNVIVRINWNASPAYWTELESSMRHLSNYLYDVSDGQVRLDTALILDRDADTSAYYAATYRYPFWMNIDIKRTNTQLPSTYGFSFLGGGVPVMPRNWYIPGSSFPDSSAIDYPVALDKPVTYRHMASLLMGVSFGFQSEQTSSADKCNYKTDMGFMGWPYAETAFGSPGSSEMSWARNYQNPDCRVTNQWKFTKQSCWDFLESRFEGKYDGVFASIRKPGERFLPSGRDYFEGPNNNLNDPDYEVGALVEFPTPVSPQIAKDEVIFILRAGTRLEDHVSVLTKTALDLNSPDNRSWIVQGKTSSQKGKIWLLGVSPMDSIRFNGVARTVVGNSALRSADIAGVTASTNEFGWVYGLGEITGAPTDTLTLTPQSVFGTYPLTCGIELQGNALRLKLYSQNSFQALPTLEYLRDSVTTVSSEFTQTPDGYEITLQDYQKTQHALTVHAPDDSAKIFFFSNDYQETEFADTLPAYVVAGAGGASFFLDSANTIKRAAVLSSPYPVVRSGLTSSSYPVSEAFALDVLPTTNLLQGDNNTLTITFDLSLIPSANFDSSMINSIRIYRWDAGSSTWGLVGGAIDTLASTVSASISEPGVYAAFTSDILTDVGDDGSGDDGATLPKVFAVHQNYPNPFNPATVISYSLPVKANVTVSIYNVLGQRVKLFAQGEQSAGTYSVTWDATDSHGAEVASGMYFYKVTAGEFSASRKMVLLK